MSVAAAAAAGAAAAAPVVMAAAAAGGVSGIGLLLLATRPGAHGHIIAMRQHCSVLRWRAAVASCSADIWD